jgi:hypothetical protein
MPRPHGLDPRLCNVSVDANALNRTGGEEDANVDRFLALCDEGKINMLVPSIVREEVQDSRTPAEVQDAILPAIFTLPVELNSTEQALLRRIEQTLQGNAMPGRHDADARHLFEAQKHGGYFITHDRRMNHTKRGALAAFLPAHLKIVTLAEFLQIYDQFVAAD